MCWAKSASLHCDLSFSDTLLQLVSPHVADKSGIPIIPNSSRIRRDAAVLAPSLYGPRTRPCCPNRKSVVEVVANFEFLCLLVRFRLSRSVVHIGFGYPSSRPLVHSIGSDAPFCHSLSSQPFLSEEAVIQLVSNSQGLEKFQPSVAETPVLLSVFASKRLGALRLHRFLTKTRQCSQESGNQLRTFAWFEALLKPQDLVLVLSPLLGCTVPSWGEVHVVHVCHGVFESALLVVRIKMRSPLVS